MNRWLKIFSGLIFMVFPLALILPGMPLSDWGANVLQLVKGSITIGVIMIGLLLTVIGISELKE